MPQIINTNISSLTAQRNSSRTQNELSTAIQRLSSGLRINSAKDDAAGLAITGTVGGVGGLHGQFTHALQDVSGAAHGAFRSLRQGNAVVGVARRLVEAADLAREAFRDGETRGVVLGAVDAQARRQAVDRRAQVVLRLARIALRGQ